MKKKYLHRPKPNYLAVRKNGKYLGRITAPVGTREFDEQYWAILNGRHLSHSRNNTVSKVITSYRASENYQKLAATTKTNYERTLQYLKEKAGDRSIRKIERKDILESMETNRKRSVHFANTVPKVLSILFEHAMNCGLADHNPAKGMRKMKIPSDRQRPHIPWTDEAINKWRAEASEKAQLILELGIGSVQRPGDLVKFRWKDYDGKFLHVVQNKTGVSLAIPCTERLRETLETHRAIAGGNPPSEQTILANRSGLPYKYTGIHQLMRKERERLGLVEFDLHGLRYRGVQELAASGCTDDEIASFSGHATTQMVKHYAGSARQKKRAESALQKREAYSSGMAKAKDSHRSEED